MKTNRELINSVEHFENWAPRYTFESWVTPISIIDTRSNKVYPPNSLIFCLISYLDETDKLIYVNEIQYFKPI